MNRLQTVFNRLRVVLPVIHACSEVQVLREVELAARAHADGVFLINQGGLDPRVMVELAGVIGRGDDKHSAAFVHREDRPLLVGVNVLGAPPAFAAGAAQAHPGIRMLWTDGRNVEAGTRFIDDQIPRLYFGGVAFKGQQDTGLDPQSAALSAAREARYGLDVVTTSGPGTGEPTPRAKVKAMRFALADHPLAVASGVSYENVPDLLPYVDAFLVASSVERSFGHFDIGKLTELVVRVHSYSNALGHAPQLLRPAEVVTDDIAEDFELAAATATSGPEALRWAAKHLRLRMMEPIRQPPPPAWLDEPRRSLQVRSTRAHSYSSAPCEACAEDHNRNPSKGCRFNPDNANGAGDQV